MSSTILCSIQSLLGESNIDSPAAEFWKNLTTFKKYLLKAGLQPRALIWTSSLSYVFIFSLGGLSFS
jgi:hypothetical protein